MYDRTRRRRQDPGWLPDAPSPEARALLFCLPYPGFGATMYRRWPDAAGGVEICPVQLPARENRSHEPLPSSYPEIAEALTDALGPYLDRPFGFFGHGPAALLGYEAAVRLSGPHGPTPWRLCVSAQPAPQHGPHDRLSRLTSRALLTQMGRLVRRAYGDQSGTALEACLRTLPADVAVLQRYRPIAPVEVACPITAIGWDRDDQVEPASMRGWSECGPTTFALLEGEHDSVLDPPVALIDLLVAGLAPGAPIYPPRSH
jgi:surfactin synthase thioesterase subunit